MLEFAWLVAAVVLACIAIWLFVSSWLYKPDVLPSKAAASDEEGAADMTLTQSPTAKVHVSGTLAIYDFRPERDMDMAPLATMRKVVEAPVIHHRESPTDHLVIDNRAATMQAISGVLDLSHLEVNRDDVLASLAALREGALEYRHAAESLLRQTDEEQRESTEPT